MEYSVFLNELQQSLVERGIDVASAQKHVTALTRTLTESDIKEVEQFRSREEFAELSDNLANAIKRRNAARTKANQESGNKTGSIAQPVQNRPVNDPKKERTSTALAQPEDGFETMEIGPKGKKIFWISLACLSPLLLILGLAFLAFFGALYALAFILIVGSLALMALIVAGGSAVAIVGLIYGVIRLFSVPSEGLYEIGLGIIIIGISTLVAILLYNLALRLMPFLIKKIGVFFKFCTKKIIQLYHYLRKECYKL